MAAEVRNVSDTTDPHFWEKLIAGVGGGLVAIGALVRKLKRPPPDYEEMARAFFAEKDRSDTAHRDAIVEAIRELKVVISQVNAATTENIRSVLAMYGKDVSTILSAQERQEHKLNDIARELAQFRLDEAKRK